MPSAPGTFCRSLRKDIPSPRRIPRHNPIQNTVKRNRGVKGAAYLTSNDEVLSAAETDRVHQDHIKVLGICRAALTRIRPDERRAHNAYQRIANAGGRF